MMKPFFPILAAVTLLPCLAHAQTPVPSPTALVVRGDVLKPRSWTLAQLRQLPQQTIQTTLKGKPFKARGVPLWSLIGAATPKPDPKVKHGEARFVVLARAKDGYCVSFAWPELMPETGNKSAFLIWEANGQSLSAKEGPFRLVVPQDKKPMRWLYGLSAIEIYDGKRLTLTK